MAAVEARQQVFLGKRALFGEEGADLGIKTRFDTEIRAFLAE